MRYQLDSVQLHEEDRRASALLGWAVATDSRLSDVNDPLGAFKALGYGAYVPHVKTAIAPIASDNTGVALLPLSTAFLGVVGRQSVLGQIDGAIRISMAAAARLQVLNVVASGVAEGAAKPTSRTTFELAGAPTKVSAQVAVTAEALRFWGRRATPSCIFSPVRARQRVTRR